VLVYANKDLAHLAPENPGAGRHSPLSDTVEWREDELPMRYPWPKHVEIGGRPTVNIALAASGSLVFLALVVGFYLWL
jgi:hypothetical protein